MNHLRSRSGVASRRPYSERPGNVVLPAALRLRLEATETTPADPQARDPELARLEAVVMIADEPLADRRLAEAAGLADAAQARRLAGRLDEILAADGSAFRVEEIAGGYQLQTQPVYHTWLARLKRTGHELRLTGAAMETLAVVAYKQPVMRAEVDRVRGVASGELIRQLMEKGLVRVAGRDDSLGRPQLYGTTRKFLQAFGLNSLKELPEVASLRDPG